MNLWESIVVITGPLGCWVGITVNPILKNFRPKLTFYFAAGASAVLACIYFTIAWAPYWLMVILAVAVCALLLAVLIGALWDIEIETPPQKPRGSGRRARRKRQIGR